MSTGILNDVAPIFRPYIQTVFEDLKLGKILASNKAETVKIMSLDPLSKEGMNRMQSCFMQPTSH